MLSLIRDELELVLRLLIWAELMLDIHFQDFCQRHYTDGAI